MASRYLVAGGTGNWNSNTNWSATDGGGSGASFPVAGDDVFFTSSSGNANVAVNVASAAQSLIISGTYAGTLAMNNTLTVSGSVTLVPTLIFAGTSALIINATGAITTNGKTISIPLQLIGTSTITLNDNLNILSAITLGTTTLTITINGNNIFASSNVTISNTSGSILGTTKLVLTGTGIFKNNLTTGSFGLNIDIDTPGTISFTNGLVSTTGILNIKRGTTRGLFNTFNDTAPANKYIILNGINESINMGNIAPFQFERTNAFSLSAWFKKNISGVTAALIGKVESTANDSAGYAIRFFTGNNLAFSLINNINERILLSTFTPYDDNIWHNVIATYSGNSLASGCKIYVDGVSQALSITQNNLASSILTSVPFIIGSNGAGEHFYSREVTHASVWNKELSQSEVNEIYNNGVAPNLATHSAYANLISWWKLGDGDTNPTATDSKSTNHGTMVNMNPGNIRTKLPVIDTTIAKTFVS